MSNAPKLISVLNGEKESIPPIWLMRQAGRYLSEYRETRTQAGGFLDLCYNEELATEVTLQPIRRFDFDAAILFSDILTIPDALKRDVAFVQGEGPTMSPLKAGQVKNLSAELPHVLSRLQVVFNIVARIRAELSDEKALIGFCGAPWTVATYMIAGHGTPNQLPARRFFYENREEFLSLLDILSEISAEYLCAQIDAGAQAVQIFDSWSSVLDADGFEYCCVRPVEKMVSLIKEKHPDVPIIGFPKGAGSLYTGYRQKTGVTALGIDWTISWDFARELQAQGAVQGNLDPVRLLVGGDALKSGIDAILENLGNGPLVFNLGHGITPDVPIDHVQQLIDQVRGNSRG